MSYVRDFDDLIQQQQQFILVFPYIYMVLPLNLNINFYLILFYSFPFCFQAIGYLLQYGYLEKKNFSDSAGSTHIDVTEVKRAIQDLQRFGNLAVTGELNRETLELLGKKRCGLKDPVKKLNTVTSNPIGQFYLQGTYWKKKVCSRSLSKV